MRKRFKTTTGAVAALVALALGGSAMASATQGNGHTHAVKHAIAKSTAAVGGPDSDSTQSGDQTTPDTAGAKASSAAASETSGTESASETSSENASEGLSANDGPGGHEDPPGNVDTQSEAQE
jgi:hypothetical protein